MKISTALITGLAVAIAAPAAAQTATPAATAAKHYNTSETPISALLADPAAKAIVDKHVPGFSDNPQISMVANATLAQIQPMKPDVLTDKVFAELNAELAKLPAK